jgi:hypothetical protein
VRDVEQVAEARQGELGRDRAARVRGVVATLADGVQLVLDDLGHRLPERLLVHEVVQVVGVGRAQPKQLVDQDDDLLDEAALLDQRAGRVRVRVLLGESREVGEHGALQPKELEVPRLHVRHLGGDLRRTRRHDPVQIPCHHVGTL